MIYLKVFVAILLTAAPFLLHALISYKKNRSEKWNNLLTLIDSKYPSTLRTRRSVFLWVMGIYRKMKFSDNARKFFTLCVVAISIFIQALNFGFNDIPSSGFSDSSLFHIGLPNFYIALGRQTPMMIQVHYFLPYLLSFGVALAMFSYRFSDKSFTYLHNHKVCAISVLGAAILLDFSSSGTYNILAQTLAIFIFAAMIYPNFDIDEQRKWRARWSRSNKTHKHNSKLSCITKAA